MLCFFPPLCVFLSEIITESYERKDVEAESARSWLEDAGAVTRICFFFSFFFALSPNCDATGASAHRVGICGGCTGKATTCVGFFFMCACVFPSVRPFPCLRCRLKQFLCCGAKVSPTLPSSPQTCFFRNKKTSGVDAQSAKKTKQNKKAVWFPVCVFIGCGRTETLNT